MAGKPNLRPVDVESQTCFREMDATAAQTCPELEKNEIVEDTEYTQDGSGGVYDGVGTQPTLGAQIHTQFVQVEREREREMAHTAPMVQQMAQPRIVAGVLFRWWMWMHRSQSDWDEPSPIGWKRVK